jgi:hypothetical protein
VPPGNFRIDNTYASAFAGKSLVLGLGLGLASLKGLGLESSPKMIKSQAFGHKKGHFCCYGMPGK